MQETPLEMTTEAVWQNYFDAAASGDMLAAFDALAALGMRPLPIADDTTGAIKLPIGKNWGLKDLESRRQILTHHVNAKTFHGVGVQADGYVVIDIDPPGKDRGRLSDAWKEAATILLGHEDWPDTLTVRTVGGCHVWFKISDKLREEWFGSGKLKIKLPCGGACEFYTGNDMQMQVAVPPSEGKAIARAIMPTMLPNSISEILCELLQNLKNPPKVEIVKRVEPVTSDDEKWFLDRLEKLAVKVLNADKGDRHDTYRKSCRTIAGYAAGMGMEDKEQIAYDFLAGAHKDAKPEVSPYVLKKTFEWAWEKGVDLPLDRPRASVMESASQELSEVLTIDLDNDIEAANVSTIKALMKQREWLWGDPERNLGWFLMRGLHLVEGKEGTGKTRWLLDLARRWSLDLPWPDGSQIQIETDRKLLFVASDSHFDQIAMTSEAFGIPDENIIFAGPETHPYDFTTLDDPRTIKLLEKWCDKYKIGMIAIDTLMAATIRPLVDPQEVSQIAAPLRQLAREKNVVIVLVGHLNSQGETWGRAIGRQCDNVIRMEADANDEKHITIKSVKARWNRFELPTLHCTQGESGWEYSSPNSEGNEMGLKKASGRAADAVIAYLRQYSMTRPTLKTLVEALSESGHAESTIYRVVKEMTVDGIIEKRTHDTFTGKSIDYYCIAH